MAVGLLGVELLVGVVGHAGLIQVIAEQWRPHHRRHYSGGDADDEQHQRLCEQ